MKRDELKYITKLKSIAQIIMFLNPITLLFPILEFFFFLMEFVIFDKL